jgi:hypothetical protein
MTPGRVTEVFTRAQPRLLADHAIAVDMLHPPIAVGDPPVARHQPRRDAAAVVDADRVGERKAPVLGNGLVIEETRGDLNGDRIVCSVVHTGSLEGVVQIEVSAG